MTARDVIAGHALWAVDVGDNREWLAGLPPDAVHCAVTSPPYYALRDYGVAGQIGAEKTPAEYVRNMVDVFRGLRRVLHPSGTVWLNLGDTYQNKSLLGIPWRVAFALQDDGWYLRQWCAWLKRNPMPDSAEDRPGVACETVFLLTKSESYFFDMEAVKRRAAQPIGEPRKTGQHKVLAEPTQNHGKSASSTLGTNQGEETRNFRNSDIWFDSVGMLLRDGQLLGLDVPVGSFPGAHFAVMPEDLVRPMILAGTSQRGVCPDCGAPWVRRTEKQRVATRPGVNSKVFNPKDAVRVEKGMMSKKTTLHQPGWRKEKEVGNRDPERHVTRTKTVGWEPGCRCGCDPVPAIVLDPFTGSGTVPAVARQHGRRATGCDLNPKYAEMARRRIGNQSVGFF